MRAGLRQRRRRETRVSELALVDGRLPCSLRECVVDGWGERLLCGLQAGKDLCIHRSDRTAGNEGEAMPHLLV